MTSPPLDGGLDPIEIASGIVFGIEPKSPEPVQAATSVAAALEQTVLGPLSSPPCGVAFSGGRDSSAVLAVATAAARKHGLEDPLPITIVFPEDELTHESGYQEAVVRHLGLSDWLRIEPTSPIDVLGETATALTMSHGLLYPGNIHFLVPVLNAVRGGSLLTGIGGDEILDGHRDHAVASMLLGRAAPSPRLMRKFAKRYVAPGRIRQQLRERLSGAFPWLTPATESAVIDRLIDDETAGSVYANAYLTSTVARMRYLNRAQADMVKVAGDFGTTSCNPLLDPRLIATIASDIGRVGEATRTDMMARYFAHLLPREVIERSSKATFDNVLWTETTTDIALGLPTAPLDDLVDEAALRELWSSDALKGNTVLIAKYLMACARTTT